MNAGTQSKLDHLIAEVSQLLNVDRVDPEASFGEIGVDSLNVIDVLLACQAIYDSKPSGDSLRIDQYTSLRDLDTMLMQAAA